MGRARAAASERLTPADVVVLAALASRPRHGYDLVGELAGAGGAAAVSRAQVYYSLKKLLGLGLIGAAAGADEGGGAAGPERETYRLSASGRREMGRAVTGEAWTRGRLPIPFQTWLMVLGVARAEDRGAALRLRREHLAEEIRAAEAAVERAKRGGAVTLAVASHALEVLRLEEQLLRDVEPMLGR